VREGENDSKSKERERDGKRLERERENYFNAVLECFSRLLCAFLYQHNINTENREQKGGILKQD
jgi:hypothetical protein